MAGDIRTLTMKILANTGDFTKGLKDAETSTSNFSSGISSFLGGAAKAFGIVTAAVNGTAFAIGVTAVKAAVENQKQDALLEKSIQNLTSATDSQIKKTFEYLDAAERAAGVNSDQLKPSFERILRSVKDITEATKIQQVAQDIAAGTGKSLTEVSDSLARAYEGNVKGLKDLGIKLETTQKVTKKVKVSKDDLAKSELNATGATLALQSAQERMNKVLGDSDSSALDVAKAQNALEKAQLRAADSSDTFEKKQKNVGKSITETKDVAIPFSKLLDDLSKQYDGAAAAAAETYAGKLEQVKTGFAKIKEELGTILLPALGGLITFIKETILPTFEDFVKGLSGGAPKSITGAIKDAKGRVIEFADGIDQPGSTGGYSLGAALRRLIQQVQDTSDALFGATGNESGFKQFLDVLTGIADAITAIIKGIEDMFAAYNRFSSSGIGNLLGFYPATNPGGQFQSGAPMNTGANLTGQNVTINISGAVDKIGTARTVVSAINSAAKQGTANKLAANASLR
jgi:esterase/lipase